MAKKVVGYIKLQVPAGKANPSPPIGPALGQRGLNIMQFCKDFNSQTQKLEKGSAEPNRIKVGRLSRAQVHQIAETKLVDLNARDIEHAALIIAGTARSMGVEVDL